MKPAPPVTSCLMLGARFARLRVRSPAALLRSPWPIWSTSRSFDVDLAVVADHQPQGARPHVGTLHDRLAADQAVLESGDVEHLRLLHHDGVLDLAVDDRAA